MYLVQKIRAPNDVNGNPRRAFLVYETWPNEDAVSVAGVYDEGYRGTRAIPETFRQAVWLPTIDVPVSEYLSWLAWGDEGDKLASMRDD